MAIPEHSKIINKMAREILNPYSIERKGKSRMWLDDQYWYTTVIEFQPFNERLGTCLNLGINFHWYEKEYFSFDIGNRESKFIDYKNDNQFVSEMQSLTNLALRKALNYRKILTDLQTAETTIINYEFASNNLWGNYHRGIISGLNNDVKKSEEYFNRILENELEYDWQIELKEKVSSLKSNLKNTKEFKEQVDEIIKNTRTKKKLKATAKKNVW